MDQSWAKGTKYQTPGSASSVRTVLSLKWHHIMVDKIISKCVQSHFLRQDLSYWNTYSMSHEKVWYIKDRPKFIAGNLSCSTALRVTHSEAWCQKNKFGSALCSVKKKASGASPLRDSSASLRGRSPGFTPAGEPRMSGRAFLLPERPEDAKSNTGSTSVMTEHPYNKKKKKRKTGISSLQAVILKS